MSATQEKKTEVALFSVTDASIAELKQKASKMEATTPAGYEEVRLTIAETRSLRGSIEKKRNELLEDARNYTNNVNGEAKRVTAALFAIEEPLKQKKAAVDEAKERERRAQEDAERLRAEEAARAERQAEEARIRADSERLAAERTLFDQQQREAAERAWEAGKAQREEQARLDAESARIANERRALEAEKQQAEKQKMVRLEKLRMEQEALERADREKAAAEAKAEQDRKDAEEASARAEALRPDQEKLGDYVARLLKVDMPSLGTDEGQAAMEWFQKKMSALVDGLRSLIS